MTNHPRRGMVKKWKPYLQTFRAKHGITVERLADLLMIPARTVESWEYEERTPPPYLKLALMEVERRLLAKELRDRP